MIIGKNANLDSMHPDVRDGHGIHKEMVECYWCDGRKYGYDGEPCSFCDGTGISSRCSVSFGPSCGPLKRCVLSEGHSAGHRS